MSRTPIALLLFGLMASGPVWSQTLTPDAEAALGSALQGERNAEAFSAADAFEKNHLPAVRHCVNRR